MKLYGVWNKEEKTLSSYSDNYQKYFGTKEEIQNEMGWLDCECDGDVDVYFQVAILDTETGLVKLTAVTSEYKCTFDDE
jgi:hypothetical protein